ncbi:hypothetical protein [Burkholderia stabilis]|uniref:hypothetical protein n=1 Tax=Burkholderia stabilis TaxID=95485 RepID=UPI001F4B9FFD|nr:hypothetical protein [Burkholderia stabilis]
MSPVSRLSSHCRHGACRAGYVASSVTIARATLPAFPDWLLLENVISMHGT